MNTADSARTLAHLFSELVDGVAAGGGGFMLNTGDAGLLASLDKLSPDDASRNIAGGATIAAHAQHVRYGLSLMNQWAAEGGNPFANARWDEAWKISRVDAGQWAGIREGLAGRPGETSRDRFPAASPVAPPTAPPCPASSAASAPSPA